jgi:asparagine synthase (glutamine-hydrolysing)
VVLAHRRLIVVDPSPGGAQPMATADGGFAITYNGELYNNAEIRRELKARGVRFRSASDTETVLMALACWGPSALHRFRGMYALGFYDADGQRLILARDPLGIKPLYYAIARAGGHEELVFASEPRAILTHPAIPARPDLVSVSAYLTTIRTVMDGRTLFDGVRTLRPGQAVLHELGGSTLVARPLPPPPDEPAPVEDAQRLVRRAVVDSVRLHLRSDVPLCCLLSGGLDSSIVAGVAARELGELHTYCSGSRGGPADDFHFARLAADAIGTSHTEAPVMRELFRERWPEMVSAQGIPLSTPNEVAINEVARTLRRAGRIVTLSGEGADEVFGGYESPIRDAAEFEGLIQGSGAGAALRASGAHPGEFQLHASAWMSVAAKSGVLREPVRRGTESDHALIEFYRHEFESCRAACGGRDGAPMLEALAPHLRFQRRVNLAGLLQRLDTATMLAGVEGRTPLADVAICALAESLPVADKLSLPEAAGGSGTIGTKLVLRRAFRDDIPREVMDRPKASFPLPFQDWVGDHASMLSASSFAREIFEPAAIAAVASDPARLWQLAWPMINIAMWGRCWWG